MQGSMDYPNLTSFIKSEGRSLAKGPIALLFIEDDVEVETTLGTTLNWGSNKSSFWPNHSPKLMRIL